MPFEVFEAEAASILSATTGFIREAGFTHSLTPARNCTFGCSYCYVPSMGIFGGLKADDARRWGQRTTFKSNTAELLQRELRRFQRIYCSPVVDPYQPAEKHRELMREVLAAVYEHPPAVFTIQTRGPLILRDLPALADLSRRTSLRVSFSVTTNRDEVRKLYEPHCASIDQRLETIRELRAAGIRTFVTLAPVLPCDPERLAELALEATDQDILGDPLHIRATKPRGATTREAAAQISRRHDFSAWLEADFQTDAVDQIRKVVERAGRRFAVGPEGFRWLAN